MVVTIKELDDYGYVWLTSKNKKFIEAWGGSCRTTKSNLFTCMSELTIWANNVMNEEMTFDVE